MTPEIQYIMVLYKTLELSIKYTVCQACQQQALFDYLKIYANETKEVNKGVLNMGSGLNVNI